MVGIVEQDRSGDPRGELLRGQELYTREQEAGKRDLGAEIEVKPLPEFVTPEVQRNLVQMNLGLRYVPALDLGSLEDLRRMGVDGYLTELQQKYPNWKPYESLDVTKRLDRANTTSRNFIKAYWQEVQEGVMDFPTLPGQWMAVETIEKPSHTAAQLGRYQRTRFSEMLGFPDNRFEVSWNDAHTAIDRGKQGILEEVGLAGKPADIRLLEAVEWNLLGNREGWGRTNTLEWTNTEGRRFPKSSRLVIGSSQGGGAAYYDWGHPDAHHDSIGFRAAVVLGAGKK